MAALVMRALVDDEDLYEDLEFYAWLDAQDQDPQGEPHDLCAHARVRRAARVHRAAPGRNPSRQRRRCRGRR